MQLCGETDGAHHPQGVVAEGDVGVERSADYSLAQVGHAVVAVDERAETRGIHAHGHGVDGEVAAGEIVVEGAVLHNGVTAFAVIALAARSHEFQFQRAAVQLGGAVVAVHRQVGARQSFGYSLGKLYAAAHGNEVDILGMALQEDVAHVAAHHIAFAAYGVGGGAYHVEYAARVQ